MQIDNFRQNIESLDEQIKKVDHLIGELILSESSDSLQKSHYLLDKIRDAKVNSSELKSLIDKNDYGNKLITSKLVVDKMYSLVINTSKKYNNNISLVSASSGSVKLSIIQEVLPIIANVFRFQFKRMSQEYNINNNKIKLKQRTLSLEIDSNEKSTRIRISDDQENIKSGTALIGPDIYSIREHVAKIFSFCKFTFYEKYGFSFQLTIPNKSKETMAIITQSGDSMIAIPHLSILATYTNFKKDNFYYSDDGIPYFHNNEIDCPICVVDPEIGICQSESEIIKEDLVDKELVILATADLQIAIFVNKNYFESSIVTHNIDKWLKPVCWHSKLASLNINNKMVVMPFVDGQSIIDFNKNFQVNS